MRYNVFHPENPANIFPPAFLSISFGFSDLINLIFTHFSWTEFIKRPGLEDIRANMEHNIRFIPTFILQKYKKITHTRVYHISSCNYI